MSDDNTSEKDNNPTENSDGPSLEENSLLLSPSHNNESKEEETSRHDFDIIEDMDEIEDQQFEVLDSAGDNEGDRLTLSTEGTHVDVPLVQTF